MWDSWKLKSVPSVTQDCVFHQEFETILHAFVLQMFSVLMYQYLDWEKYSLLNYRDFV
jgi:hypothetical protein